jgi:hypothetical protein
MSSERCQSTLYSDNPIAQGLLVKQLERYHLNVTATENGMEAIAGEYRPRINVVLRYSYYIQSGNLTNRAISVSPSLITVSFMASPCRFPT